MRVFKTLFRLLLKATIATVIATAISTIVATVRRKNDTTVTLDTWPDVPENPSAN